MATTPTYLRSTDGNDADNGTTWALANATLEGAIADTSTSGTIYASQNHSRSTTSDVTFTFAGTTASPMRLIGGNDGAEPPTAVTTPATAMEKTTGTGDMTINGDVYASNFKFICGDTTGASYLNFGYDASTTNQVYENCIFEANNNSWYCWGLGTWQGPAQTFLFDRCSVGGHTTYSAITTAADLYFRNCTWTTANTSIIYNTGNYREHSGKIVLDGCDLSACASTVQVFPSASSGASGGHYFLMRNCKVPSSWTLAGSGITSINYRAEAYNCDSGSTNYKLWVEDYFGSIRDETTIVRTGGASDGTTPLAWKMAANANAAYPSNVLRSPEIVIWNDTTGSSKTATIEFVHDTNVAAGQGAGTASAFQNNEVWIEVEYLGTSGNPLASLGRSCPTDILTAAADCTSSSATWTTTGMTTPVKQKLSVTFTPQKKGFIQIRVCIGKASKTIYVDPMITVS